MAEAEFVFWFLCSLVDGLRSLESCRVGVLFERAVIVQGSCFFAPPGVESQISQRTSAGQDPSAANSRCLKILALICLTSMKCAFSERGLGRFGVIALRRGGDPEA